LADDWLGFGGDLAENIKITEKQNRKKWNKSLLISFHAGNFRKDQQKGFKYNTLYILQKQDI